MYANVARHGLPYLVVIEAATSLTAVLFWAALSVVTSTTITLSLIVSVSLVCAAVAVWCSLLIQGGSTQKEVSGERETA
jgi:heme/copper-type cytochrome/quinol oxidase subunit 4